MSEVRLSATIRTEFGKGAARRLRRAAQVPAVLYGHGTDPIHISLPAHATQLALRVANALLDIEIEGQKPQLALPKQVQRDPVSGAVEHIDLVLVRRGEKVTVQVPLVTVGEHSTDVVLVMDQNTISLEVEATHIPTQVEIDITGIEVGTSIHAADLKLPEGATFAGDPEDLMVSAHAAPTQEQLDTSLESGEAAEPAAPATEDEA